MSGDVDGLVARVRERRKERLEGLHLKHTIPGKGWDGDLVARYEVLDYGTFDHDADLLARVCTRLYLRDEDGKLRTITADGQPVQFDGRLTALLGRPDLTEARDVVRYVFDEGNDTSLSTHAVQVFAWLRDTSLEPPGSVTDERADHELDEGAPARPTPAASRPPEPTGHES